MATLGRAVSATQNFVFAAGGKKELLEGPEAGRGDWEDGGSLNSIWEVEEGDG